MPTAGQTTTDPAAHTMSIGDHLEELRRRIILALAAPLPLFVVVFFFSDTLIEWLLLPVYRVLERHGLPAGLQVLSPPEFLLAKLKLSMIMALVLTAPWVLYQLWRFVAPGLYTHEQRFVRVLIPGGAVMTLLGIALLYFVMLPLMLHMLVAVAARPLSEREHPQEVTAALDDAAPIMTVTVAPSDPALGERWLLMPEQQLYVAVPGDEENEVVPYLVRQRGGNNRAIEQPFRVSFVINFTLVLMLGIAIAFQMPIVILLLGWLGIADPQWLKGQRRYALGACALLAAILTPADVASMIIMLVPLYGLYELGILLLKIAPASAVAEGRLLGGGRTAAKPDKPVAQTVRPVQSASSVPRDFREDESDDPGADVDEEAT